MCFNLHSHVPDSSYLLTFTRVNKFLLVKVPQMEDEEPSSSSSSSSPLEENRNRFRKFEEVRMFVAIQALSGELI